MEYLIAHIGGKQFLLSSHRWEDINFLKFERQSLPSFCYLSFILLLRSNKVIQIGKPFLSNILVPIKILQNFLGKKILVLKVKPKKKYKKIKGFRSKNSRIILYKN